MQRSMYFMGVSDVWRPGKVIVIILIMMEISQSSLGYVGTSDSTVFFFGSNYYGTNSNGFDRILDLDVSILRSTSCGGYTTVLLYDNNTLVSKEGPPTTPWKFTASVPKFHPFRPFLKHSCIH